MTCHTEATSQMPTLNSEQASAAVSHRYWTFRNGRSARGSDRTRGSRVRRCSRSGVLRSVMIYVS